jgi:hypothetical protein
MTFIDGIFNVAVFVFDEDEMLRGFCAEGEEDKWLSQNEFVDNFSFKISSPGTHRICGFNLFTRSCMTSGYSHNDPFYIEIRNNTSGRSLLCTRYKREYDVKFQSLMHMKSRFGGPLGNVVLQSLSHWKLGGDNPTFDNGDDVSISVRRKDPAIQIRTIGVQWLHEEEGKDDDFIQSKDEVITAHNISDDDDDAAHVPKVEIAWRQKHSFLSSISHNKTQKESDFLPGC